MSPRLGSGGWCALDGTRGPFGDGAAAWGGRLLGEFKGRSEESFVEIDSYAIARPFTGSGLLDGAYSRREGASNLN